MPKSISSRPSVEQVNCMLEFMEKHPQLGLGKLKGVYGAAESKKLWLQLTRLLNATSGPNRAVKSWMKFWADKKSMVKAKVSTQGGDPTVLTSNVERKIWDGFIAEEESQEKPTRRTKKQLITNYFTDSDNDVEENHIEDPLPIMEPLIDFEERQMVIVKKMVKVMDGQASALMHLANTSAANAQAMSRLADAAQIQARALQGLAGAWAGAGAGEAAAGGVAAAVAGVDVTLKRLYSTMPA